MDLFSSTVLHKRLDFKRIVIDLSVRSSNGSMGRFGGGWNWALGFRAGGRTIVFSLLIAVLVLHLKKED